MRKTRNELLQSIIETMGCAMRSVHAGPGFSFGEFRLGPPQVRILFLVAARGEGGVSVKDLAMLLGVTPGAVTQFVDVLVEKDLLRREEHPNDRRILRIRLTEFAQSSFKQFKAHYFTQVSRFFDTLSDREVEQLAGLLARIDIPAGAKERNRHDAGSK